MCCFLLKYDVLDVSATVECVFVYFPNAGIESYFIDIGISCEKFHMILYLYCYTKRNSIDHVSYTLDV